MTLLDEKMEKVIKYLTQYLLCKTIKIYAYKWPLSWTKWSEQAKRANVVSEKVEKTGQIFFHHYTYMVEGWFICVSVHLSVCVSLRGGVCVLENH